MAEGPLIGWDLGGAHLKAARLDGDGRVCAALQLPCPLWRGLDHLESSVDEAISRLGTAPAHAATMSGEMTDLFPGRAEGVRELVRVLSARVAPAVLRLYAADAGFVSARRAGAHAQQIASANWHAAARYVARRIDHGLYLEVGSTTTDLTPVSAGRPRCRGRSDRERLICEELVYRGVVRTPVMAMAPGAPCGGEWIPFMAELFSTAADVYRLTGQLPDGADQQPAADGCAKTVEASARRLARMVGCDLGDAPLIQWRTLAEWLAGEQLRVIEDAARRVLAYAGIAEDGPVVGAGCGRFVAEQVAARLRRPYVDFADLFPGSADPEAAALCAPAVAVACLARQLS